MRDLGYAKRKPIEESVEWYQTTLAIHREANQKLINIIHDLRIENETLKQVIAKATGEK